TTRDEQEISGTADWSTWYFGFLYDYYQIRQDPQLGKEEKQSQIDEIISRWRNFIDNHQVD
ncbi:hypothetical protein ACFLZP_05160, partial [Patescibacteria group bacterium]